MSDPELSIQAAAAQLQLSEGYVRRLCRDGELTARRNGPTDAWIIVADDRYRDRLPADPAPSPDDPLDDVQATLERIEAGQRALQPSPEELEERRHREQERDERLARIDETLQALPELQGVRERLSAAEAERDHLRERVAELEAELQVERERTWWDRLRGR